MTLQHTRRRSPLNSLEGRNATIVPRIRRRYMIENEDSPTTPRPTTHADTSDGGTIQIPAAQATSAAPPALPSVSVDDLLALQLASDPQIAPDGTRIAFVVQRCNSGANTTSSAIWLVDMGEGKAASPWQGTSGEQHDFAPRWSPDGRTLAFLSDRSGTTQVYLLPMNGGEARRLSNLPQGISEYSWR